MDFLIGLLRSKTDVPIVNKLTADLFDTAPIKEVCLDRTDNPVFDCYAPSVDRMNEKLDTLTSWLEQNSYRTTGWWVLEIGNDSSASNANFTYDYIDSAFNHGAGVVTLFTGYCKTYDQWPFFDANGNPKKQFMAVAGHISDWQVANIGITETVAASSDSNIILASDRINSKLTLIGAK